MTSSIKAQKQKRRKQRVCASRKGRKIGPRRRPIIGEVVHGHTVTGILPTTRQGQCVAIVCGKCHDGIGACLFADLCRGDVKSCRCLRIAAFSNWGTAQAAALSQQKITGIFSDYYARINKFDIARKHGINYYVVGFAGRREWARLEAISKDVQDSICALSTISVAAAMIHEGMTWAQVRAVQSIRRRQAEAVTAVTASWSETLWNRIPEDNKLELVRDWKLASSVMQAACWGDPDSTIEGSDLFSTSDVKRLKKLEMTLAKLSGIALTSFGGFSLKTQALFLLSRKQNFDNMRAAIDARAAGKPRYRRRRARKAEKPVRSFDFYQPFEPHFNPEPLSRGFNLMADLKIAA